VTTATIAAPQGRGGLTQAFHDSFVVTKRNLRRMTRIRRSSSSA